MKRRIDKKRRAEIMCCDGSILPVLMLPQSIAIPACRGIARDTNCDVTLHGEFGVMRFRQDGSGSVEWNELSSTPGSVTEFDSRTTVCI